MKTTRTVMVRNAFTGRRGTYEAYAEGGRVWVYDSIAGHYTTLHALTPAQCRYVLARASR